MKGSDSYWRKKRSELYTWINHHVEMGNGPPNFFITLSCAEYHWPDIIRLVKDRMTIAENKQFNDSCHLDNIVQIMNDYSVVVQEYFQKRVEIWLETVGKQVLGIQHYWLRYEFAPSRGQIHAHLLAISNDKRIQYEMYKNKHDKSEQAHILSEWASKKCGLTAMHTEIDKNDMDYNPVDIYFSQVDDINLDTDMLKQKVQIHDCSKYCLRPSTTADKENYKKQNKLDK